MQNYLLEDVSTTRNKFKEEVTTYVPLGMVRMFISFASIQQKEQNAVSFDDYTHIGLTRNKGIKKNQRIGGQYTVQYVLKSKPYNRVFLKEIK